MSKWSSLIACQICSQKCQRHTVGPNQASFFDWIATPEPTLHMILHSRRHHAFAFACLVLMVYQYCIILHLFCRNPEHHLREIDLAWTIWSWPQFETTLQTWWMRLCSSRSGLHVVCVFTSHLGVDPTLPSSGSSNTLTDILQLSLSASRHDHLHYTSNWWNPASNWLHTTESHWKKNLNG